MAEKFEDDKKENGNYCGQENYGKGMLNRTTINKEDWKDPGVNIKQNLFN